MPINRLCAWCGRPLGFNPKLPPGVLSHGICRPCSVDFAAEPDNLALREAGVARACVMIAEERGGSDAE